MEESGGEGGQEVEGTPSVLLFAVDTTPKRSRIGSPKTHFSGLAEFSVFPAASGPTPHASPWTPFSKPNSTLCAGKANKHTHARTHALLLLMAYFLHCRATKKQHFQEKRRAAAAPVKYIKHITEQEGGGEERKMRGGVRAEVKEERKALYAPRTIFRFRDHSTSCVLAALWGWLVDKMERT